MPDEPPRPDEETLPWEVGGPGTKHQRAGMVVDLRRCIGCHACSVACKTEHDVALGIFRTRVRWLEQKGKSQLAFLPMLCMHCQDAPCVAACPHEAIRRADDGRVLIDEASCEGDQCCTTACPYGAIGMDPQTGRADKCDLCANRTDVGLDPACVNVCPTDVLRFGDLDDPQDEVTRYAAKHEAKPMKPEEKTRPSVLYIGLESWMEKKAAGGVQLSPDEDELIYVQKKEG